MKILQENAINKKGYKYPFIKKSYGKYLYNCIKNP